MRLDSFQVFITLAIYSLPGLIIGFTLHEFAHAVVADRFGDPLPRAQGRLTLDPLTQVDALGLGLLLAIGFGFARPVQINLLRIRTAARQTLVALCGPATNLLIAIVCGIVLRVLVSASPDIIVPAGGFRIGSFGIPAPDQIPYLGRGGAGYILFFVLFQTMYVNVLLFLFNIIPIPPLDGFAVLKGAAGRRIPDVIEWMERNQQLLWLGGILVILVLPRVLSGGGGNPFTSATDHIVDIIYGGPKPFFGGLYTLLSALTQTQ